MSIFSENLRALRGDESQASFSKQIGLHVIQYSKYERGVNNPSIEVLERICRVHACSANWLLGLPERGGSPVNAPNNSGSIAIGNHTTAKVVTTATADCKTCPYKKWGEKLRKQGLIISGA